MVRYLKIFFPPLAISIYELLLKTNEMTANEIATRMGILPHSVYRTAKTLKQLGLIEWVGRRPARFKVKPHDEAIENYLLLHREWFYRTFLNSLDQSNKQLQNLDIYFIRNKETMYDFLINDFRAVKESAHLVVSGLEAPAEIVLENKRAIERGVSIKTIVQETGSYNKEMLSNWKKMGIEVRVIKLIEVRIFLFDQKIVYLLTYQPLRNEEIIGIRLAYPPIARLINELFVERWKLANTI